MSVLEVMKQRKSVRKYLNTPVSEEQIQKLMEAAMTAPSAMNKRPWHFYVIKSEDKLKKVKDAMPFGKYNAPLIIIPCVKEIHTLPLKAHDLAYCDLGAATENILLEAVELGLSTVWCAIYPGKERIKAVKKALNIPVGITPYSCIFVGYEDGNEKPKDKFDKSRIEIL